jgi:malate/lactate dehydrogenase
MSEGTNSTDSVKGAGKLAIVGAAGGLGSSMTFLLGLKGLFKEIVLLDPKANVLATHEIDLRECFVGESATSVKAGSWEDAKGADVVIMCAALTGAKVGSRNEYLLANLKLIRDTASMLNANAPESLLIVATAPLDVYVMIYCEELGRPRHRVMGYSYNDSHRFRWILGKAVGVDPGRVKAIIIGEHGEAQVPVWSSVTVDGEAYRLKDPELATASRLLAEWYPHWQSLNSGRTTTWSSTVGMLRTVEALRGGPGPLMGSVVLEGEYGIEGVALGVPLTPGGDGVSWGGVIETPLDDGERFAVHAAAEKIRELHAEAKAAAPEKG